MFVPVAVIATLAAITLTAAPSGAPVSSPPYPSTLTTEWTAKVSKTLPWSEYPRPQMVRSRWQNLNGPWEYALTAKAHETPPAKWDGKILVPFCAESLLSGVRRTVTPDDCLWYRRTFTPKDRTAGERLILRFDAVDWQTRVWVNGKPVGEHQGGYTPFGFDVTDALREGENELLVRVYDPTRGYQPCGKQKLDPGGVMYTPVSGIWQTVWLEPVPAQRIESVRAETTSDRAGLRVIVDGSAANLPVTVTLRDGSRTVITVHGKTGEAIPIAVPGAKLWTPEKPFLYGLTVKLDSGDSVESYAAVRTVALGKDANGYQRILLNGKPVFQYGPLDQGWWPDGLYTPPTDAALKSDITGMKRMGFNMVRKHVKVEPARWYAECDRQGLLVWQDMPNGWGISSEEARANFDTELKAMVDFCRPFPSVVFWTIFNEGWGQKAYGLERSRKVTDWLRDYDPNRLVSSGSGWFNTGGDHVMDMHCYPGPGILPLSEGRAAVLSEFGGLRTTVKGHTWQPETDSENDRFKGDLKKKYAELMQQLVLLREQGLAAAVYTQLTDVEIELNGYLTYDRRINKLDSAWLRAVHAPLYQPGPRVTLLAGGETPWQMTRNGGKTSEALGPFGTTDRNIVCRTPWSDGALRLEKTFHFDGKSDSVQVWSWAIRGASLRVEVNGVHVPEVDGGAGEFYRVADLKAGKILRTGENRIVVTAEREPAGKDDGSMAAFEVRVLAVKKP